MWFITLILFVFILGIIVLVHELGHFLWARAFGVHIYEFSIGMGPVIFTKVSKKDGIKYHIRALPIGGFVSMAGEVYEDDKEIPKEKCLCNKPIWQRIIVMAAGVMNNFILAIILLLLISFIWGSTSLKPTILDVVEDSPMEKAGFMAGDTIISVNNHKVNTWDETQILLYYKSKDGNYSLEIERKDGTKDTLKVAPETSKDEDGNVQRLFGMYIDQHKTKGFVNKLTYAFQKFGSVISSMYLTIWGLLTGKISVGALSGPVGIYSVVGSTVEGFKLTDAIANVVYLIGYLSINVGVINILPFPAFDGGHILFLVIEKIKGSPVNQKFEDTCHTIGFILLMLLIIYVTFNDIIKLF